MFRKYVFSSKRFRLFLIVVWFSFLSFLPFLNIFNIQTNLSENVNRLFFKFSYVHWTISFSSIVICSVSFACFFAFRLLVFLNSLMILSWWFIFMNKGLDWWIKVAVTHSLYRSGSISQKGLSLEMTRLLSCLCK